MHPCLGQEAERPATSCAPGIACAKLPYPDAASRASSASRASWETVFPSSAARLAARSRTDGGTRKAICGDCAALPDSDGRPTVWVFGLNEKDFAELSESDLTNGELKFGLPAAMIVLLLLFMLIVTGIYLAVTNRRSVRA